MKNILNHEELNKIKELCEFFEIQNYTINSDGSVDVNGDVILSEYDGLHWIPIKFNKVSGDFRCNASELTTLKNAPREVGGDFEVGFNDITSLENSPIYVGGTYYVGNNSITSLEHLPKKLHDFNANHNKLRSLEHMPSEITGYFSVDHNKLKTLEHCPSIIGSDFHCTDNKLTSLKFIPKHIPGKLVCEDNRLTSFIDGPTFVGGDVYLERNNFPIEFVGDVVRELTPEELGVFLKYQTHLDIWTNGFDLKAALELVDDIKGGLR